MVKLTTLGYLIKDNKTLMLHRIKKEGDIHKGKYNGLGGKFEPEESPEQCFIREVEEESGYIVKNPKLLGIITFPKFWHGEDTYVFVFSAKDFSGNIKESLEGDLHWIENDKLLNLPLNEGDYIFMPWIYENKPFFSAIFNYDENKKLLDWNVNFY